MLPFGIVTLLPFTPAGTLSAGYIGVQNTISEAGVAFLRKNKQLRRMAERLFILRFSTARAQTATAACIATGLIKIEIPGAFEMREHGFDHFRRRPQPGSQRAGLECAASANFIK